MSMKIPIEIQQLKDKDTQKFKIIVSLQDAITHASLDSEFNKIQVDYILFINNCKEIIKKIQKNKINRGDSTLKWKLADNIYLFTKKLEERGFIFANLPEALSRDLKISPSEINRYIDFRVTYPQIELIDKKITWDK